MSRQLWSKAVILIALCFALLIPIGLTGSLISERAVHQATAEQSVKDSISGAQRVSGLILLIPYKVVKRFKKRESTEELVPVDNMTSAQLAIAAKSSLTGAQPPKKRTDVKYVKRTVVRLVDKEEVTEHELLVTPDQLKIDGHADTKVLWRSLYPVQTYNAKIKISGSFALDLRELAAKPGVTFGTPKLVLGISDVRGLTANPDLRWRGQPARVSPGSSITLFKTGVHALVSQLNPKDVSPRKFSMTLNLAGTQYLSFTPLGRSTAINLTSDWPHPSFGGRFLPVFRDVTTSGFTARWSTTDLATNLSNKLIRMHKQSETLDPQSAVSVSLVDPVNPIQQVRRATKYALMFILLTFAGFLLYEVLRKLRIHALQYGLVGCALAIFFVLLLALSEHVGFAMAYGIASTACVTLIGVYLSTVLRGWRPALGFSAGLLTLYGCLYGILLSEDYALLMGAALLFSALASIMVLTRRVDWYSVGTTIPSPPKQAASIGPQPMA